MKRLLFALSATVAVLLPAGSPVQAASCNGASHEITLSNGRANPGSGTTSTTITFSVVYADTAGCPPSVMVAPSLVPARSRCRDRARTSRRASPTRGPSSSPPARTHTCLPQRAAAVAARRRRALTAVKSRGGRHQRSDHGAASAPASDSRSRPGPRLATNARHRSHPQRRPRRVPPPPPPATPSPSPKATPKATASPTPSPTPEAASPTGPSPTEANLLGPLEANRGFWSGSQSGSEAALGSARSASRCRGSAR